MEHAQSNQGPSFAVRLIRSPVKGLWFLIKHPILAIIIALLITLSSVSFLAHFNPAIAERFNSAMGYFLGATLLSEASDALRLMRVQANRSKVKIAVDAKRKNATIARKNTALLKASDELNKSSIVIRKRGAELNLNQRKLAKFAASGRGLEKRATKRFTKVAIADAAGEVIGWIPVVGDVASVGMTAAGIYEMCQMFKEIEDATTELGVPYRVYTDTFCEKPAERTAEVISDTTTRATDKVKSTVQKIVYKVF